jgi:hypothetical protein
MIKLADAIIGIFIEQGIQDLPRRWREGVQEIGLLLPKFRQPLPARNQRGAVSHMQEQIQCIGVFVMGHFGQVLRIDAAPAQLLHDLAALLGQRPSLAQVLGGQIL